VQSKAKTIDQYLAELPADRRGAIMKVRTVILNNIPEGFKETMQYGMISYVIPIERYPNTYNRQPLAIVALASQKNYMSFYLMSIYGDEKKRAWFKKEHKKSGKKLNMGKSCVRFKKVEDLPLDLIAEAVARTSVKEFIERYEESRKQ
jgi:uncharacterized protein YdhG (YjbR/CyaY superfamily)